MDTTYWGRGGGIMLFKDAISGDNLLKYYVQYETNAKYIEGVNELIRRGFQIKAIVCDGRRCRGDEKTDKERFVGALNDWQIILHSQESAERLSELEEQYALALYLVRPYWAGDSKYHQCY